MLGAQDSPRLGQFDQPLVADESAHKPNGPGVVGNTEPGARLTGKVEKLEKYGVFVFLAPGRTGLIPMAETGGEREGDVAKTFPIDPAVATPDSGHEMAFVARMSGVTGVFDEGDTLFEISTPAVPSTDLGFDTFGLAYRESRSNVDTIVRGRVVADQSTGSGAGAHVAFLEKQTVAEKRLRGYVGEHVVAKLEKSVSRLILKV